MDPHGYNSQPFKKRMIIDDKPCDPRSRYNAPLDVNTQVVAGNTPPTTPPDTTEHDMPIDFSVKGNGDQAIASPNASLDLSSAAPNASLEHASTAPNHFSLDHASASPNAFSYDEASASPKVFSYEHSATASPNVAYDHASVSSNASPVSTYNHASASPNHSPYIHASPNSLSPKVAENEHYTGFPYYINKGSDLNLHGPSSQTSPILPDSAFGSRQLSRLAMSSQLRPNQSDLMNKSLLMPAATPFMLNMPRSYNFSTPLNGLNQFDGQQNSYPKDSSLRSMQVSTTEGCPRNNPFAIDNANNRQFAEGSSPDNRSDVIPGNKRPFNMLYNTIVNGGRGEAMYDPFLTPQRYSDFGFPSMLLGRNNHTFVPHSEPSTSGIVAPPPVNQDSSVSRSSDDSNGAKTGSGNELQKLAADQQAPSRKKGTKVPDEEKTPEYQEKRRKNNEAAKRSRDARRRKEDELALRAKTLMDENHFLRNELKCFQKIQHNLTNEVVRLQTITESQFVTIHQLRAELEKLRKRLDNEEPDVHMKDNDEPDRQQ